MHTSNLSNVPFESATHPLKWKNEKQICGSLAHIPVSADSACNACSEASEIPGYTVKLMGPDNASDCPKVTALFEKTFIEREPLSHALAISGAVSRDAFSAFCRYITEATFATGMTSIATIADGSVIGFIMAAPLDVKTFPTLTPRGLEPMYDIVDILDASLQEYLRNDPSMAPSQVVEITMGGVCQDFEGVHIAADLVWVLLVDAYLKGFRTAVVKASSRSQIGFQAAGFVTLAEVSYKDYQYAGSKPFSHIERPPSAKLMKADLETYLLSTPDPRSRRLLSGKRN
ncbi:hypothetical protein BDV32DRAFT_150138 [Aspergillus pseudonomiae]|uniref:Uncharacterized protein n=1 Tax=Aspergillus pseudonomiae TaxID=1506151 RepID=A0A5N7DKA2_9EURO|nr:uncharacterized protein BDV37DRAFT_280825 [Aspergillus pseudonomiae]KAB8259718.1 hypothetical protein BDV32DRAFT_150138 [Aspergillus pseudonomiae]KAE8406549.1 hypothetical protein BDV37DRAFT_280825 [Aspergillus pseudonomiae]